MSENDASTSWFGRVDGTHEDADLVLGTRFRVGNFDGSRFELCVSTDLSLSVQSGLCNDTQCAISSTVIGHMHAGRLIM